MEAKETDDIVIDLRELLGNLIRKMWIILSAMIVTAGIGFGYTKLYITPQYTAMSQMYVFGKRQSISELSLSDLQMGSQLTSDYMIMIKSRAVMEQVILNLGLDMSYGDLANMIQISNPNGSRILRISMNYSDPHIAKSIVDEVTKVSCARIADIMDLDEPRIFEYSYVATNPSSPNVAKNTILCAFLGGFLVVGVIVILYLVDDTVKTPGDLERYLELPLLATLPMEGKTAKNRRRRRERE